MNALYTLVWYIYPISLFVLGSMVFPRKPLLGTTISVFILGLIAVFILAFFSSFSEILIDTLTLWAAFLSIANLWLSYRRMCELEVIDHMYTRGGTTMKTTTKIIIGLIAVSYLLPFTDFEIERTTEKVFLDTSVRASFKAKEAKAIASYAVYSDQLNTDQYRVMLIPDDKVGGIVVDYPAELVEVSLSKGVLQINKTKRIKELEKNSISYYITEIDSQKDPNEEDSTEDVPTNVTVYIKAPTKTIKTLLANQKAFYMAFGTLDLRDLDLETLDIQKNISLSLRRCTIKNATINIGPQLLTTYKTRINNLTLYTKAYSSISTSIDEQEGTYVNHLVLKAASDIILNHTAYGHIKVEKINTMPLSITLNNIQENAILK